jgi:hypothetical protein
LQKKLLQRNFLLNVLSIRYKQKLKAHLAFVKEVCCRIGAVSDIANILNINDASALYDILQFLFIGIVIGK